MVSATARVSLRIAFAVVVILVAFYVGRPLYWKLSATIHEIREKKQTVREGLSQFVLDARRTVGWVHDESDSGIIDDSALLTKAGAAANRRMLWFLDAKQDGRS